MSQVRNAIFLRNHTRSWSRPREGALGHSQAGRLRNVHIDNVFAKGQTLTSAVVGLHGTPIENVSLSNVHITSRENGGPDLVSRPVPELPGDYPEITMFRRLPAYGLYARHVRGLKLHNVCVELEALDMRPALFAEDVNQFDIDGFSYHASGNRQPAMRLRNTSRVFVRGCHAAPGTPVFLSLEGAQSTSISLIGNDFSDAAKIVELAPDIPAEILFLAANRPAKS